MVACDRIDVAWKCLKLIGGERLLPVKSINETNVSLAYFSGTNRLRNAAFHAFIYADRYLAQSKSIERFLLHFTFD